MSECIRIYKPRCKPLGSGRDCYAPSRKKSRGANSGMSHGLSRAYRNEDDGPDPYKTLDYCLKQKDKEREEAWSEQRKSLYTSVSGLPAESGESGAPSSAALTSGAIVGIHGGIKEFFTNGGDWQYVDECFCRSIRCDEGEAVFPFDPPTPNTVEDEGEPPRFPTALDTSSTDRRNQIGFTDSRYGTTIPLLMGRGLLTGNVIWAQISRSRRGLDFAVGLSYPLSGIIKIFLNNKLVFSDATDRLSNSKVNGITLYNGDEAQPASKLMEYGVAHRGLAYLLFDDAEVNFDGGSVDIRVIALGEFPGAEPRLITSGSVTLPAYTQGKPIKIDMGRSVVDGVAIETSPHLGLAYGTIANKQINLSRIPFFELNTAGGTAEYEEYEIGLASTLVSVYERNSTTVLRNFLANPSPQAVIRTLSYMCMVSVTGEIVKISYVLKTVDGVTPPKTRVHSTTRPLQVTSFVVPELLSGFYTFDTASSFGFLDEDQLILVFRSENGFMTVRADVTDADSLERNVSDTLGPLHASTTLQKVPVSYDWVLRLSSNEVVAFDTNGLKRVISNNNTAGVYVYDSNSKSGFVWVSSTGDAIADEGVGERYQSLPLTIGEALDNLYYVLGLVRDFNLQADVFSISGMLINDGNITDYVKDAAQIGQSLITGSVYKAFIDDRENSTVFNEQGFDMEAATDGRLSYISSTDLTRQTITLSRP